MGMNHRSAVLIIRLICEGIGVAKELKALAERVRNGERITDKDIDAHRAQINVEVDNFKKSVSKKKDTPTSTPAKED